MAAQVWAAAPLSAVVLVLAVVPAVVLVVLVCCPLACLSNFCRGKGADAHQSMVASQKMSARHAQQVWWLPGTWVDITMRRPALQVAHALLTGIEGVSFALALSVMVRTSMG